MTPYRAVIAICVISSVLTGCKRSKPAASGTPAPQVAMAPAQTETPPAVEPASSPNAPPDEKKVATKEEAEDTLRALNVMVADYKTSHGQFPKDLNVFIQTGGFYHMPPAPEGRQYRLNPATGLVTLEPVK